MRIENEKGRANPMAMSAEERQQMLLTQPVEKIIPKMALPTICSMLITSIYNMADTYFVSQIGTAEATASGTSASAAVGIVFSAMAMIQALAFMFGMGSGTNVSHLLGMGKRKEAEVYSAVGFFSAVAAGVLIAVLGNVFNEPLMRLLGATETAMPYALDYARYIFLAAPFMMGSLSMNNLLRFQGLAMYGMVGIISGGLLNMLLDPLLIFVFDMGIAGASIATAISQLTSFVILLVMCSTHADAITIHPRNYRPTKQMYGKILNNGLPSLGRQGIMSVSTSLLNNAAAVYGDPAIAAFAIVSRCLNFVNSTVVGFGQGFQPVCGFNYGARKYDRMHRAFSFSVKVTTIVLLVLGAAGFAFAEPVVTLFRRSDPEVIRIGTETFRIQILTVWAWGFITLSNMYTQAIGYGIRSTILAAARQGLFLIPTLLVLPNVWGLRGLEVCQPLADVLTLALAVWMMTKVIRAQKAQMAQETA